MGTIQVNSRSFQAPVVSAQKQGGSHFQSTSSVHAHTLAEGDSFNQKLKQGALPWPLRPAEPLSESLNSQIKSLSRSDKASLLRHLANTELQTEALLDSDGRSPHHRIRIALALALKSGSISVSEALDLRGMLLQLPPQERARYQTRLAQAAQEDYVKPILNDIDLRREEFPELNAQEFAWVNSASFKLIFPNFTELKASDRKIVVAELGRITQHFPNLLQRLNQIKNENYGPGFQFFFVTPESNKAFDRVLPKGVAGIIMPGAGVIKDPILGLVTQRISMRMLDRGGIYKQFISRGTFTHEFAHVIHLNVLNDDQRDALKSLYDAAWRQHSRSDGAKGFVTPYAQTNPYEYFAEGVEYFLVGDQKRLQQQDPAFHQFLKQLFADGAQYSGDDGHLFNDPERIHALVTRQGGTTLGGVSVSRESDVVSMRHFEGSVVTELQALGGENTALARGSIGLKAGWKPWDKPASVYATVGGVAQAGMLNGQASVGVGGYAGVGLDYKGLNAEIRQNWMAGKNAPPSTEFRLGWRFEF